MVVREGRVKEVADRVLSLQSLISQLRRQVTLTQERVPQLEDAKKAAVAGDENIDYENMEYMCIASTLAM